MRFHGIIAITAAVASLTGQTLTGADNVAEVPEFNQVYDLIRQNAAGVTDTELNHAAI